jgi:hypothetical protein
MSLFNCEVISVSDTEIVCWVTTSGGNEIKTAFLRSAIGNVHEGSELIWDSEASTLTRRDFDNSDILAKLDLLAADLGPQRSPASVSQVQAQWKQSRREIDAE